MQDDLILLRQELERERDRLRNEAIEERKKYQGEISALESKLASVFKLSEIETQVKDSIIKKLNEEKEEIWGQAREMAKILKIPRLHHAYIRENGVDNFVDRCKSVVDYHDKMQEDSEKEKVRMYARIHDSVEKSEQGRSSDYKLAQKEYNVAIKKIPFVVLYPDQERSSPLLRAAGLKTNFPPSNQGLSGGSNGTLGQSDQITEADSARGEQDQSKMTIDI